MGSVEIVDSSLIRQCINWILLRRLQSRIHRTRQRPHQGNDRRPLELVVNTVAKDKVTGYISVPKAGGTQSAASD